MMMIFHRKILYPLWGLIVVFIIMFICGLNWWKVIHDTVSLLGTVICIGAAVGVVGFFDCIANCYCICVFCGSSPKFHLV